MPIYVSHATLTEKGIQEIADAPARVARNTVWQETGSKLLACYVVLGDYDYLLIVEAPNERAMAEIALRLSRPGRVRTRTYVAFPFEELKDIVQRL